MLMLGISGIEPEDHYELGDADALGAAIRQEAAVMAAEAGSDLLDEGTVAERGLLEARLVDDMAAALKVAGDVWRSRDGYRYRLYEKH